MPSDVERACGKSFMPLRQTIGELGEFALISAITERLNNPEVPEVLVGIGDDSAVIQTQGQHVVACLDMMTQGVHFRLDWSSARDIGGKVVAANLSDIYAMGAKPTSLLVGLAMPANTEVNWVLELADGMRDEAARVGVRVVGGDVVRADSISLAVTALGDLEGRKPILRSGAQVGDVVAVAGQLGYSAAGLLMLSRGFRTPRVLVNAHRAPQPRYDLAQQALHATSMIDVSDGLVSDLDHIARASGVSININSSTFEISDDLASAAGAFNGDALEWILTGGEDHAFVATFSSVNVVPDEWLVIGTVGEGNPKVLIDDVEYLKVGWNHFS